MLAGWLGPWQHSTRCLRTPSHQGAAWFATPPLPRSIQAPLSSQPVSQPHQPVLPIFVGGRRAGVGNGGDEGGGQHHRRLSQSPRSLVGGSGGFPPWGPPARGAVGLGLGCGHRQGLPGHVGVRFGSSGAEVCSAAGLPVRQRGCL